MLEKKWQTIENKGNTTEVNYTLLEKLPEMREDDLIIWKGHVTKFGLSSLNEFQMKAIQSVQHGRDTIPVTSYLPCLTAKNLLWWSAPHRHWQTCKSRDWQDFI